MASGDERLEQFDQWTLGIRYGTANDCNNLTYIPEAMFFPINCNTQNDKKLEERDMKEFCMKVFPD